jgi:2-polyprenyl-6-methoxyphenol hydroxylase-like FAD-dependent oxidoreductase
MTEESKTMDGTRPSVLIAGASFAGLSAAYWMDRLGYAVTVVEVAGGLRKGGTPVNIRDGVIEVVRRMGILERIVAESLKPRPMVFVDRNGEPVTGAAGMWDDEESEVEEYEIERDVLLQMLFDEVKDKVEVMFGDCIAGLEETAEEVDVSFAGGARRGFSLVLGCDGTHSALRRMWFGEEDRFVVPMQNYFSLTILDKLLIEQDTQQMFQAPGKTVMLNAYNGKTDIAFCFLASDAIAYDRRDREQQKRMVAEKFAGERWRIPELLEEMAGCEDFYFDMLCQVRMESWSKGRVALVGDAAYCPSPAAGMGGSMAILGAAALADAIERCPGDLAMAFKEYDRSFRPIAEAIQNGAIEFGLEMVMPGSKEAMERAREAKAGGALA